ncbi:MULTISPECIES: hypothetical protein [Streptomyces]|uniref:Uncharacterized protein n=1 Tax=Streptomyces canarius TaxID=285453 RepID=A0ABQ3DCB5_9ACTN|nr:hypothetical protein [Streptomyces canarius]GHA76643.1 hypothetical protein GCM10010345_93250 [Streptomyces canarius]
MAEAPAAAPPARVVARHLTDVSQYRSPVADAEGAYIRRGRHRQATGAPWTTGCA